MKKVKSSVNLFSVAKIFSLHGVPFPAISMKQSAEETPFGLGVSMPCEYGITMRYR